MSSRRIGCYSLPALIIALLSSTAAHAVDTFFEDFQGGVMPPGWAVVDVDGQTPNANVSIFTDAWIVREDFSDNTNFVAMSTSWYDPVGQSDDWMISPPITLGTNEELSWRAKAQDPAFPDGYEVRISTTTQDVAGCSVNPPEFSIAAEDPAWTDRTVNLSSYNGLTVYLCFRNNSYDQFVLIVDDIRVAPGLPHDASVTDPLQPTEYGQLPTLLGLPVELGATVTNEGSAPLTNVILSAQITQNGIPLPPVDATPIPTLASGASQAVTFPPFVPAVPGPLEIEYTVRVDETDGDAANDSVSALPINVTAGQLGRDDGNVTGSLGIGPDVSGELGNVYRAGQPTVVDSVYFVVNGNPDLIGTDLVVNLRSFDAVGGTPGEIIATSNAFTVPDDQPHEITVTFPGGPVEVPADFFVTVVEPTEGNLTLATSEQIFSAGMALVDWPGNPLGGWAPAEDFGYFVTFVLRPNLVPAIRSISLDKTASPMTYMLLGDSISYSYLITNTGNVTLDPGAASVTDDKTTVTCPSPAPIAPGSTVTCNASYYISQTDLDAGSLTNQAIATVDGLDSNQDSVTVTRLADVCYDGLVTLPDGQIFSGPGSTTIRSTVSINTELPAVGGVVVEPPHQLILRAPTVGLGDLFGVMTDPVEGSGLLQVITESVPCM